MNRSPYVCKNFIDLMHNAILLCCNFRDNYRQYNMLHGICIGELR